MTPDTVSVRVAGLLPASPRTMFGTQSTGTFGEVEVQVGGRSMERLKPGPGSSWLPEPSVASGEFGPVGSSVTFVPPMFSPAESPRCPRRRRWSRLPGTFPEPYVGGSAGGEDCGEDVP